MASTHNQTNLRRSERTLTKANHIVSGFMRELNLDWTDPNYMHEDSDVLEEDGYEEVQNFLKNMPKANEGKIDAHSDQFVQINVDSGNEESGDESELEQPDPLEVTSPQGSNGNSVVENDNVLNSVLKENVNIPFTSNTNVSPHHKLMKKRGRPVKGKENLNNTYNMDLFKDIMPEHVHEPTKSEQIFQYIW